MALVNNSGYAVEMFEFERNFDYKLFLSWIHGNWTLSIWYALVYVVVVFAGRRFMSSRPRFELRVPLIIWSSLLSVFSIVGAMRIVPELIYVLRRHGWTYSVCNQSFAYGPTAFWCYAFVLSKAYELGDTIFIILRKQSLIFLHWYHHLTVLLYVWYSYSMMTSPGRWLTAMNYTVHAFMYTYYAGRAMQFRLPRSVSMFITSLQIVQMVMGLIVTAWAYHIKSSDSYPDYCQLSYKELRFCALLYVSYLVLFVHFFYVSYVQPKSRFSSLKNHHDKKL